MGITFIITPLLMIIGLVILPVFYVTSVINATKVFWQVSMAGAVVVV